MRAKPLILTYSRLLFSALFFVALFQEALCSYLKHHAAQLKRYTYGKHILVRLEKISGEKML